MATRLLWLWASVLLLTQAQEGPPPSSDAEALLAQRGAVTNWPQFAAANGIRGWDDSLPLCQWSGVVCSEELEGRVQSLSLQCDGCPAAAQGLLAPQLANLSAATTINLQGNAFSGTLPPQWGGTAALAALQNLYLNDNSLSGSLPGSWGSPGALPQLSLLRIDGNRLGGSLPGGWGGGGGSGEGSLPNLMVLRLFDNQLSGSLPAGWGSSGAFPRLQILALQNNSLTGAVPATWQAPGAMQYLQELYLQANRLSGQLPGSWGSNGSWPLLSYLYLSNNMLGGTLPPEWGQPGSFSSLRVLHLNDSQLTGTLPAEWGDGGLSEMEAMFLERNSLTGTVPPQWANLSSLSRLTLRPGNAKLCGPLPAGLPFVICTDEDISCLRDRPTLLEGSCAAAAGGGAAPRPSPAPPDSGGGGVSAVAIAVPVAVGAALLAAAAGCCAWAAVRRRRRQRWQQEDEELRAAARARSMTAHPFDTEEGRAALTSPFAAGAFQSADPFPSGGSGASERQHRSGGRSGSTAAARQQRGPHDSADTHTSSHTASAGSLRSMLAAKCARIDTKSMSLDAGSSESGVGRGAAEPAPPQPPLPPDGFARGSLEMQPLGLGVLSPGGYEERDALTAMHVLSGQAGSSDQTSAEDVALPPGFVELPFSDWELTPQEIEILKRPDGSDWCLGSGGFGQVYKALRHGVQPVAVKVLSITGEGRQLAMADFRREIAILKGCRDVNIVQFVGASLTPDRTMLVTEYLEGGNLANNITAGRVSWYRRGKKIALDVARGLVFLHSRRIVHFDLKSPNIMLAKDGTAKIGDVGMAKILAREYVTGVVGTLAWAAPEMLWGERCTEKADIYSYGIVLWEIASGEKPVRGQLRDLSVPQECPAAVRDLILECLETRPSRRPSALEIVQRLQALPGASPAGSTAIRASPSPTAGASQTAAAAAAAAAGRAGSSAGSGAGTGGGSAASSGSRQSAGTTAGPAGGMSGSAGGASVAFGQRQASSRAARSLSEGLPPRPPSAAARSQQHQPTSLQAHASSSSVTSPGATAAGAAPPLQQRGRSGSGGEWYSI